MDWPDSQDKIDRAGERFHKAMQNLRDREALARERGTLADPYRKPWVRWDAVGAAQGPDYTTEGN
ncbi:MAG: hypothetical protein M3Q75_06745 [Gemmatimonadota bacterium]|nr:hypothetical protein [Gemmatimonadota bacterium]